MHDHLMNTTRRYPRSLAEAWPRDYSQAIERPARRMSDTMLDVCAAIAIGVAFTLFIIFNWGG